MRVFIFSVLLLGIVLVIGFVILDQPAAGGENESEAVRSPTLTRVELIAQGCATCHGTEGRLQTAIPSLAGKPEAVLYAQLLAFQRDEMPGATVMPRLARGYSEEELRGLAQYFATKNLD